MHHGCGSRIDRRRPSLQVLHAFSFSFSLAMLLGYVTMGLAHAQDPSARTSEQEPVELQYRERPECPTEAQFRAWVASWTERISWDAGQGAHEVELEFDPETATGTLQISSAGRAPTRRSMIGDDCPHVVEALAFVLALRMDPTVRVDGAGSPVPSDVPETRAPRSVEPDSPESSELTEGDAAPSGATKNAAAPSIRARAPANAPSKPSPEEVRRSPSPRRAPPSLWLGAAAMGETGFNSSLAPGVVVHSSLVFDSEDARNVLRWAPELRVGAGALFFSDSAGGTAIRGRVVWGRMQGCALSLHPVRVARFQPCLTADLGVLRLAAPDLEVSTPRNDPWFAVGLDAEAHFWIQVLQVDMQAGVRVHPRRASFEFGPEGAGTEVFRTSLVSGAFSLGISYPLTKSKISKSRKP